MLIQAIKHANKHTEIGTVLFPGLHESQILCIVTPDHSDTQRLYYAGLYSRHPDTTTLSTIARGDIFFLSKGCHAEDESRALDDLLQHSQSDLKIALRRQLAKTMEEFDDEVWKESFVSRSIDPPEEAQKASIVGHGSSPSSDSNVVMSSSKKDLVCKGLDPAEGGEKTNIAGDGSPPSYHSTETISGWRGYIPKALRQQKPKKDEKDMLDLLA